MNQQNRSPLEDRRVRLALAFFIAVIMWVVVTTVVQPGTTITLHPQEGTITLDRAYSGFNRDIVNQRTFPASLSGETIRLRLILDRYSAELFMGEGEQAASMVLYTPLEAEGISMRADTAVLVDVEKYEIVVD